VNVLLLPLVVTGSWAMYGGIAALGVGLLVVLLIAVPGERTLTTEERVRHYAAQAGSSQGAGTTAVAMSQPTRSDESALKSAKSAADNVLKHNVSLEMKIQERLEGAGAKLRPGEWLLLHTVIFLGVTALGLLIGNLNLIVGLIFAIAGAVLPWFFLGFKRKRRKKRFERSLPDTLQLMSGSLAAGLSLAQSVDTIVREGSEPITTEFKRVLVETRLGLSLEDSLQGVAERFKSKDFEWVVMAINIQRQVGGNLAELLTTVAATMREREYLRRQVSALSAEGKLSAYILGGLPPGFLGYLLLANRTYVMVLFTRPLGILMLVGAAVILSIGIFAMNKIVKVEV
jgi:tight adherence protein B